ncbi:IS481 family transposase [Mycolicibacterium gadium]|uniref:IS481 family transposase n=1 Tax=Mycolicibacterium gadium TaxID=1794 RepID=UPI002FDE0A07
MAGHPNAPLTPAGRRRLCERVDTGRPIAHVAAEAGISRRCLAKWYARWTQSGPDGLRDQSSAPGNRPGRTDTQIEQLVEQIRRATKYGPARIAAALEREHRIVIAPATVHRILVRRGINHLTDLDPPTGEQLRAVLRFEHDSPGSLVHVDVKKLGRIPSGGGWWAHGRGTELHRASKRRGQGTGAVGYTYLHSALDDHSRLAYTEPLDNEKGVTAADFWRRAVTFYAEHGITAVHRVLTDNGSCYRSRAWARALDDTATTHKRTRPYTPRTNGKVERFNGTLTREWAYVREYSSEEERRAALVGFLNYYNHERPHAALSHRPPSSRVPLATYRLTNAGIIMPIPDRPEQLSFDDLTA